MAGESTIFDLTELAEAPAAADVFVVVDVSDTTDSPEGTTKKVSSSNVKKRIIRANTGTTDTLVIGDAGNVVTSSNASAQTVTIPPNASVAFSVGTQIDIINKGVGVTSVAGGAGVTVNGVSTGTGAIDAQYKAVTIIKDATDIWFMVGAHGTVA